MLDLVAGQKYVLRAGYSKEENCDSLKMRYNMEQNTKNTE